MQKPFKDFNITVNGNKIDKNIIINWGDEISLFDVRYFLQAVTGMIDYKIKEEAESLFPGNPDAETLMELRNDNRDFN